MEAQRLGVLVRVDRATVFGNPYRIGRDGTREDVLAKYRAYILAPEQNALLARVPELIGKRLACWCAPLPCHGHILVELAELAAEHRQSGSTLPLLVYIRQEMALHPDEG